jgi:hypothetical protein
VDVRHSLHPTLPVRQDGFDLGLLEHDLRYIYTIRVRCPSPR